MQMKLFERPINQQEQLPLEFNTDDDFFFQSENKTYDYYIGVKFCNNNKEVRFNCTTYDENNHNKISSSRFSRHPQIMRVYNDLKCAADDGLDSFINALKAVDIGDKKLLASIKLDIENIEENILLQNESCRLTY